MATKKRVIWTLNKIKYKNMKIREVTITLQIEKVNSMNGELWSNI